MYILPIPKKTEKKAGDFVIDYMAYVVMDRKLADEDTIAGKMLKESVKLYTGYDLHLTCGEARKGDIYLSVCDKMQEQAYRLIISPDDISICGGSSKAVFYGVQTLRQMLRQYGAVLPCQEINDKPDIAYRGYYFDQTRGRVLKLEELKRLVDEMCLYKLNQLQLYVEHTYLFRDFSELWRDETPLTAEDILELDEYCAKRHVELVPSMACFGHLYMLLSTRTYGDLCEMSDSWKMRFSLYDRMRYHTINVTDDRSFFLIRDMIREYMQLFRTDKFNICADETFYLGKEKSKEKADKFGVERLYVDFLKKLCTLVVEEGKIPMFWGDIICRCPQLIKELPDRTICLNWGYAADQREDETRILAKAGARQYVCPGVGGWNEWMNLIRNSYENIVRMCTYAQKYGAIGVLNTDWGDFGHINQPEYSLPGMIYAAAFSWNMDIVGFDEINRQISKITYNDPTGTYVSLLSEISSLNLMRWRTTVLYYEVHCHNQKLNDGEIITVDVSSKEMESAQERLEDLKKRLLQITHGMKQSSIVDREKLAVTLDAISLWNKVGYFLSHGQEMPIEERYHLAENLERWFMHYKKIWRKTCLEGDLRHIASVVFWYADRLRQKM